MDNINIAKNKIKHLTSRTERDLYGLRYEAMESLSLNDETFHKLKMICNANGLNFPLYKYGGVIKWKNTEKQFYKVLNILAQEHHFYLNHEELPIN